MATSADVPGVYPVAVDGRPYLVDLSGDGIVSQTIPLIRDQADQGARPGEATLNPDDLWRRSVETWHHGAGQARADGADSDQFRFHSSLHVDPWTKYELSKLPKLGFTAYDSDVVGQLALAGDRLYWESEDRLVFTAALPANGLPALTPVTGAPAAFQSMTTDGKFIYTTHGADDVFITDDSISTAASFVTNASVFLDVIRFVKGRLLVFDTSGAVYNPIAAGAIPTALFTHPLGVEWNWTDATAGVSNIYMTGTSGFGTSSAQGAIYRCAVQADGTALDIPIIAGRLPDGESARSICGYLGLLFVGTSLGVRICQEQSDGSVVIGPLIQMGPQTCLCFEGQGSQVWFGIDEFVGVDGVTYAGLGRIDLSEFPLANGTAPYASDLMSSVGDNAHRVAVGAVVTFQGRRVFTAFSGLGTDFRGLYVERTDEMEDVGHITSGEFGFDLTENKIFRSLKVRADGPITAAVSPDYTPLGPSALGDDTVTTFDLGDAAQERLEWSLAFGAAADDTKVQRATVFARPTLASRSETLVIPLLLSESLDLDGSDKPMNVADEVARFRRIIRAGDPVTVQEGADFYDVVIENYQWQRKQGNQDRSYWNGVLTLQCKRFDTATTPYLASGDYTQASGTVFPATPDDISSVVDGDIILIGVAWHNPAVAIPAAPTGWALTTSHVDTAFASAVYTRRVGASAGTNRFQVTFASSVEADAAYVVYRPGTTSGDITVVGTAHSATGTTLAYGSGTVTDPSIVAAVTVATQPPHGPFRARATASSANLSLTVTDLAVSGTTVPAGSVTLDASGESRVMLVSVDTI